MDGRLPPDFFQHCFFEAAVFKAVTLAMQQHALVKEVELRQAVQVHNIANRNNCCGGDAAGLTEQLLRRITSARLECLVPTIARDSSSDTLCFARRSP